MVATTAARTTTRMSTITVSRGKTKPGTKVGVLSPEHRLGDQATGCDADERRGSREEACFGEHAAHRLAAAESDRAQQRQLPGSLAHVDEQRVDDSEHGDDHRDDRNREHEADRVLQGIAGVAAITLTGTARIP